MNNMLFETLVVLAVRLREKAIENNNLEDLETAQVYEQEAWKIIVSKE